MELYRVKIQLTSPLVTPLKGDTIWGHVAWGIANHEGDEAVQKFLDACKDTEPAFIVSSAFPTGFVCKPIPLPHARDTQLTPESYAAIKKCKKDRYVRVSDYLDTGDSAQGDGGNPFSSVIMTHNSINRFSNMVTEGGGFMPSPNSGRHSKTSIYISQAPLMRKESDSCVNGLLKTDLAQIHLQAKDGYPFWGPPKKSRLKNRQTLTWHLHLSSCRKILQFRNYGPTPLSAAER